MESDGFALDSIATVVDCINFTGYEDTSYTAKIQAQYTDVILLNKHELVSWCAAFSPDVSSAYSSSTLIGIRASTGHRHRSH